MRTIALFLACIAPACLFAQGTVPTFRVKAGATTFTLAGSDPAQGRSTTIPVTLVPIALAIEGGQPAGKPFVLDPTRDAAEIVRSPLWVPADWPGGGKAAYIDGMMRATFPSAPESWHTVLGKPEVKPLRIAVPVGSGYVLTSRSTGRSIAIVDLDFVQKEVFRQVTKQEDRLVIAVTRNTAFYALGDATVCCSWGTHGVDTATGNSFVLSTYLSNAPSVVQDADLQPLSQQIAQFFKDPLHDPLFTGGRGATAPGNVVPAWMRTIELGACAGPGMSSQYFQLEPTNTNPKNNLPVSPGFATSAGNTHWHLQNVALLPWYTGPAEGLGKTLSFPDPAALTAPATPCPARGGRGGAPSAPTVSAAPRTGAPNGHKLIGYWSGVGTTPAAAISPQWDVVLVAFATPDHNAPEGTMQFRLPAGVDAAQFKQDVARLKQEGRTVMISLGGGGQHFTLADPKRVPTFVGSIAKIVSEYGFEGVDIDFESPSLSIDPGDTDHRHPTTPSIVNLITALRQLRERFGPSFLISLVPEGTQIPSGFPSYGGQFGSYLPILHALRDVLAFVDVQDYNTPPLLGLDGEIYQPGTVDYHAAMTELLLRGFHPGGNSKIFFDPVPANRVAVGFLNGDTTPEIVRQAMDYLITGKAPAGVKYRLQQTGGYPDLLGAMFWTLDQDRRTEYRYSNTIGPQLHGYPAVR